MAPSLVEQRVKMKAAQLGNQRVDLKARMTDNYLAESLVELSAALKVRMTDC